MTENKLYPDVSPNPDFARIEEKVLKFWEEDKTFEKSVQNRPQKINGKNNEYIFYDGPPFANGLPHYGHLLTGFVKDMFARFQTMKGKRVERRFGWDCHGLPAEMGAEKELGISGRQQITGYGIEKFNDYCQTSVMKYASEWEYYVTRQGRWVDFKNDYKTMDKSFMESVMWAFKQLYDKGWIYEAYRVVPYSWAAETPLSNFETHLDNSYRMRQDPAVTVAFELKEKPKGAPEADKYYMLAWTTTPWTLPSNLALAVKGDMGYSSTLHDGKCYIHGAGYAKAIQKTLYADKYAIETPRLIMREFTKDDFKLFAGLSADAEVNALLKTVTDEEECKKMFDTVLSDYKKYGFSKWAVFEKETGEFVGRAGVNHIPGVEDVVEVGYVLHKKFWGKGYATEIAKASYDYAFANLGLEEVSSLCHADNAPSRKVMQKFGLKPNGKLFYPWLGDERERHTITRDEYFRANGMLGKDLVGATYKPLFPYFKNHPNAFRILEGDFIEEGQGTGVVHMAPGFGEDDQRVCEAAGIKLVVPVDHAGKFTDEIFDLPYKGSKHEVETARVYLRPFEESDWADFLSMQRDPEVAKTTSDGLLPEEKIRAEFDRFMADHKKYGYSQWAVIEKESGKFVGRAGLDERDFTQFIEGSLGKVCELRYCFKSEFWGNGFATELTPVILDWAFNTKGFDNIIAGNNPTYGRSINVLTRYGFEKQKVVQYKNQPVDFRVLSKEAYSKKQVLPLSLKGRNVLECNKDIIAWLKAGGSLVKQETIDHSYPHCWRTDQPLIYKAVPSWYVEVTKFRHRMVELNKQINWIPGHVKEGLFGKWIENARDWSISRNRFWGAPIPIWRSDNPENKKLYVFGSIKELEEFFGTKVENLHRPYIDNLTKVDPDNPKYTLRRVEDVLDCWFESGSMPYGQVHYPFENSDLLENGHFPADFIVEYQAQTRGWFYTLMVLSTALFDKPPFLNCICHGVVLDDKGQKLSKRLNNYADPKWLFDTYGADALRWFMMSSPVMRGSEMYIDKDGKFIRDAVRLYIKPFWNAYSFFTLYANADGVKAEYSFDSTNIMDRYILTKLHYAVKQVDEALEKYDTVSACNSIAEFFEVLNNWYIRRSKERFWKDEKDADKQSAYNTLYTVLHVMCRVAAPLLPMVTEEMFSGLVKGAGSVHLADYPFDVMDKVKPDSKLEAEMDLVRDICNSAHSIRSNQNIRVRQPLGKIRLAGRKLNPDFTALVLDEVNAKTFEQAAENEFEKLATFKLQLNMKKLGAKLGQQFKTVLAASKSGDWKKLDGGLIEVAGVKLEADEFDLKLVPSDEKTSAALSNNDAVVILDTTITSELEKEGIARDLVRMIQQARKDAKLDVSDKISLGIKAPDNVVVAFREHREYITAQTLTSKVEEGTDKLDFKFENDFDGEKVVIALSKAA